MPAANSVALRSIPSDPAVWDLDTVGEVIRRNFAAVGGVDGYQSNALYLAGDHRQDGRPWMGPGIENGVVAREVWTKQIEPKFVPVPEVESCVWRRTNAACANEPDFSLTPTRPAGPVGEDGRKQPSEEQARVSAEWGDDLGSWWSRARVQTVWQAIKQATTHASGSGQACIRLFWNRRFVADAGERDGRRLTGIPPQPDRRSALRMVECSAPPPDACAVYHDPDTLQPVGVYRYTTSDDVRRQGAEIWYVDDTGRTVLRKVEEGQEAQTWTFDWGGVIPIVPLSIEPILTEPVRRMQAAADTSATCAQNLSVSHGYTQRTELDVMPPGEFKTTPPPGADNPYTIVRDGTTLYLWPSYRELGPSVNLNLFGHETTKRISDNGGETVEELEYHVPRVEHHEPSDPENVLKVKRELQRDIRSACHQGHIIGDSTAEASGDAYEQKRAEFTTDVNAVAAAAAYLNSGVLVAATVMADELVEGSDAASFVEEWLVSTRLQADPGPPSTEKLRITSELVEKEIISVVEGQVRSGVQDTGIEAERMAAQKHPAIVLSRATAAKAMIDAGVSPVLAWEEVGYPEDKAREFARNDFLTEEE